MIDALRLMISRSPAAAGQAIQCISAIKAKSPVLQHRYNRAAESAFSDPQAEFSPEERELIASYVAEEDTGDAKATALHLRVSKAEKEKIEQMAQDAGLNVSDFIRSRIGL